MPACQTANKQNSSGVNVKRCKSQFEWSFLRTSGFVDSPIKIK